MVETTTTTKEQKNIHSKLLHTDSDITCPEISSDDAQAGHSAYQNNFLTLSNNVYITGSKQFHEESIYNKVGKKRCVVHAVAIRVLRYNAGR